MGLTALFAVGLGAAFGAWLRWLLGLLMNPLFPTLPLGTLAANLLGGFLMGLALGVFAHYQSLAPEWRLFITTGFLGGLTTFSTFSAEAVTLLLRQQYGWFAAHVGMHVAGTLAATLIGFALIRFALRA
ncbi:MAG TPA: fluoride efflux transporter CrcB [Rhodanobacteraceae bacterium]|nr:fluoride efflux transporter CrcB [Rhodanobacteraceae bacterium]HET8554961.1 fluoride efflux transporter CrcB [Rhodanobacteraceae bacterium]